MFVLEPLFSVLLCVSALLLTAHQSAAMCWHDESLSRRQISSASPPETPAHVTQPKHVNVGVVWHQVHNATHGTYPRKFVQDAIAILNKRYTAVGFKFHLQKLDVIRNDDWFVNSAYNRLNSPSQMMKRATHVGTAQTLNVWTTDFPGSFTGFSTFPYQLDPKDNRFLLLDGIVYDWKRVPGVNVPKPLGNGPLTVVHEVGHWFGLEHTFLGGCDGRGDLVDDTPPSSRPRGFDGTGCALEETCPGVGPDKTWLNPMSYTLDECYGPFTPGQIKRMWFFATEYRNFK